MLGLAVTAVLLTAANASGDFASAAETRVGVINEELDTLAQAEAVAVAETHWENCEELRRSAVGTGWYLQPEPLLQHPVFPLLMAMSGLSTPTYSYAMNNPLMYVDPDGLSAENGAQGGPGGDGSSLMSTSGDNFVSDFGQVTAEMLYEFAKEVVTNPLGADEAGRNSATSDVAMASVVPFTDFQKWGREDVGWGSDKEGARACREGMTPDKAKTLDPKKVEAAKKFYQDAAKAGKGGEAAKERAKLMQKILRMIRRGR